MKLTKKYKLLAIYLIFVISVITGGEFLHNHTDANSEDNHCPVCIVIHSFSSVDFSTPNLINSPLTYNAVSFNGEISFTESQPLLIHSDRAPPSHS